MSKVNNVKDALNSVLSCLNLKELIFIFWLEQIQKL